MESIRFGLLGTVVVRDIKGVLIYPTGREARLLTVLLLKADEPVWAGHLMDAIWDEERPASPDTALHNVIYRLRRFLAECGYPDLISKGPGGYTFSADRLLVDSHRFEWLLGQASMRERCDANDLIIEGLALWRGLPFEGLATGSHRLEAEANRLRALKWVALESRIDCDLDAGKYRELIPELVGLTTESPLRENLWAYLMAALYFCDNQGRALRVYRRARGILAGEYGMEPSQSLRELEAAVLDQDDARVRLLSSGSRIRT